MSGCAYERLRLSHQLPTNSGHDVAPDGVPWSMAAIFILSLLSPIHSWREIDPQSITLAQAFRSCQPRAGETSNSHRFDIVPSVTRTVPSDDCFDGTYRSAATQDAAVQYDLAAATESFVENFVTITLPGVHDESIWRHNRRGEAC